MTPAEKRREYALRVRYNITAEERDAILAHQGGVCAICGRPEKDGQRRFSVDHDHVTGMVRGILDLRCNRYRLGGLTLEEAEAIVEYLREPPAFEVIGQRAVPEKKPKKRQPRKRSRKTK